LSLGFWNQVFLTKGIFQRIPLNIGWLIQGDFGAASAMITFGAIIGKCSLQ
jgi:hypothetical protein